MRSSILSFFGHLTSKKRWSLLLIFFFLVGASSFLLFPTQETELAETIERDIVELLPSDGVQKEALADQIDPIVEASDASFGIVIKSLTSDMSYEYHEHEQFPSASLYKLWVMKVAYDQIANGSLSREEVFDRDIVELNLINDIATESAEKKEGRVTYTTEQAISQMITVSDNYAAYVLADRIGLGKVRMFLEENNFTDSSIAVPPTTSAYDIARFYELLYKGRLSDPEQSEEMITLLKNQQLNSKLPMLLPEDIVIAHKTGELGSITHDAGIVYTKKGDYIIVVLTDSDDPEQAIHVISEISKTVYSFVVHNMYN